MLLVVCPNLAINRILAVRDFCGNKVQRSTSVLVQPGGKGCNVAQVFRQLGGDAVLTGFVGRGNGGSVGEPLRRLGIHVDTVNAFDGDCRTCTIVLDPRSSSHPTVINEESPEIEKDAGVRLLDIVSKWIPHVDAVLVTGSLASGLASDFYFEVLSLTKRHAVLTAIDAAGTALSEGLRASPDILKLNAEEFATLGGEAFKGQAGLVRRLKALAKPLAPQTIVTFGEEGAVLHVDGRFWHAAPPVVSHANPIGCGDTFVAAYIHEFLQKGNAEVAFSFAMAAAASDASTPQLGFIDVDRMPSLVAAVTPIRI